MDKMGKLGKKLIINADYVIMNEILWKLLIKLYGGGPEIESL